MLSLSSFCVACSRDYRQHTIASFFLIRICFYPKKILSISRGRARRVKESAELWRESNDILAQRELADSKAGLKSMFKILLKEN